MVKYQNYSLTKSPESIVNGEVFEYCNFTQAVAGTIIFSGATGLTFRDSNLVNCIVPKDSIVKQCNTTQKSYCSHLHPNWGLDECDEDCEHVRDTDEIWIDGKLTDIVYYYRDVVL